MLASYSNISQEWRFFPEEFLGYKGRISISQYIGVVSSCPEAEAQLADATESGLTVLFIKLCRDTAFCPVDKNTIALSMENDDSRLNFIELYVTFIKIAVYELFLSF